MKSTFDVIVKVLKENFGIIILDEEDFAISDYISDSISFIQFIIAIEEQIQRELSDDFLYVDVLDSAKGFAEKLNVFFES